MALGRLPEASSVLQRALYVWPDNESTVAQLDPVQEEVPREPVGERWWLRWLRESAGISLCIAGTIVVAFAAVVTFVGLIAPGWEGFSPLVPVVLGVCGVGCLAGGLRLIEGRR